MGNFPLRRETFQPAEPHHACIRTRVSRLLSSLCTFGLALLIAVGRPLGRCGLSGCAVGRPGRLVIDYGDGAELRFKALAWKDGMTVLDALEAFAPTDTALPLSRADGQLDDHH